MEEIIAEALDDSFTIGRKAEKENAPCNFSVSDNMTGTQDEDDDDAYQPDESVDMLPSTFLPSFGEGRAKGKCSVCVRRTSKLNCPTCFIKQGNWGYKRYLQRRLTQEREDFLGKSVEILERIAPSTNAVSSLAHLEEEIRSLQRRIAVKKSIIIEKRKKLKDFREKRSKSAQQIRNFQRNLETWPKYVYHKEEKLMKVRQRLTKGEEELGRIRRKFANDAFLYIFPIRPIADPGYEGHSTLQDALAEATLTNYVDGQWVFNGSSSSCFRIINSRITEGKDFVGLEKFLFPLRENSAVISSRPPSQVISSLAALLYASQLCDVLSRVYNIKLPFCPKRPLNIIDFSALTHDEFVRNLLKLFMKIGYLCLSQAQGRNCVEFSRPFCNLYSLCKNLERTGRDKPYRPPTAFIQSFLNETSGLSWPSVEEQEGGWDQDAEPDSSWEHVTEETIPLLPSPSSPYPPPPTPSIAGLLTSATSSISNFFGRVDRGGGI